VLCATGSFSQAYAAHPLVPLLLTQWALTAVVAAALSVCARRRRWSRAMTWAGRIDVAAIVVVWIYRLSTHTIP
jgi:hypothetical protein